MAAAVSQPFTTGLEQRGYAVLNAERGKAELLGPLHAEMYPVPQRAETQGRSEEILGAWLAQRRRCASPCTHPLLVATCHALPCMH